jgi:hypothetical protein
MTAVLKVSRLVVSGRRTGERLVIDQCFESIVQDSKVFGDVEVLYRLSAPFSVRTRMDLGDKWLKVST